MDRRMLTIGAATVALWAIGCGDSNDDETPAAAQGPDVGQEFAPNSGVIEEPIPSAKRHGPHGRRASAWRQYVHRPRSAAHGPHGRGPDSTNGTSLARTRPGGEVPGRNISRAAPAALSLTRPSKERGITLGAAHAGYAALRCSSSTAGVGVASIDAEGAKGCGN
jgi:hypothetical protein